MAVEFSRDITFGQYLDLGSPVHRLDPRAKIVGVSALMVAVLLARTFGAVGVMLLAAAAILWASRVPPGYLLRGMRPLAYAMVVIGVFQLLFYPSAPDRTLWRWGIIAISWDGMAATLIIFGRIVLLYYLVTMLMLVTPLMDLADGVETLLGPLKRLRVPVNELVMTMVVALKFVPLLVQELERLVKAQAARGVSFDRGGLGARARAIGGLLVPLFVGALARAEVLAVAMSARCYRGGNGRTRRRVLTFRRADGLATLIAIAIAALAIAV
jgi:energy-coupling factor transport system permease protein